MSGTQSPAEKLRRRKERGLKRFECWVPAALVEEFDTRARAARSSRATLLRRLLERGGWEEGHEAGYDAGLLDGRRQGRSEGLMEAQLTSPLGFISDLKLTEPWVFPMNGCLRPTFSPGETTIELFTPGKPYMLKSISIEAQTAKVRVHDILVGGMSLLSGGSGSMFHFPSVTMPPNVALDSKHPLRLTVRNETKRPRTLTVWISGEEHST